MSKSLTPRTDAFIAALPHDNYQNFYRIAEWAEGLEQESDHWKRMYECAQNANALRQEALDGHW